MKDVPQVLGPFARHFLVRAPFVLGYVLSRI
jgi:hypothetical protein